MIYINIFFFIYRYDKWGEKIRELNSLLRSMNFWIITGEWLIYFTELFGGLLHILFYFVSSQVFFTLFILLHTINLTINILQKNILQINILHISISYISDVISFFFKAKNLILKRK